MRVGGVRQAREGGRSCSGASLFAHAAGFHSELTPFDHNVIFFSYLEYKDRGLNIIAVHATIHGKPFGKDSKLHQDSITYMKMEGLKYNFCSATSTDMTTIDDDRVVLDPQSAFKRFTARKGYGVPTVAIIKDCETVWRSSGYQARDGIQPFFESEIGQSLLWPAA